MKLGATGIRTSYIKYTIQFDKQSLLGLSYIVIEFELTYPKMGTSSW